MHKSLLALALAAAAAAPATGQIGENPVLAGGTSCGAFTAMDYAGRLAALTAVQPLGDAIGSGDRPAAEAWADQVAAACAGTPDRPLAEAAALALAAD